MALIMEKIRTCKICSVTSDCATFYEGVTSRCAECHKAKVRENRAAKAEYYRAYDAKRYQEDPKVRARHRKYRQTPAGRAAMGKGRVRWQSANPEKRAAHIILGNAVRDGRVEKPDTCERCGKKPKRLEGHHEDYAKPLEVTWFCRSCHAKHHREAS